MTKPDAELDESDIRDGLEEGELVGRGCRQNGGRAARRNDDDDDDDEPSSPGILPDEILKLLQTELTVGPEIAGKAFGLGRSASYAAARNGQIPAHRIGTKLCCPTAPLRRMLGIDPAPVPPLPPPQQVALQPAPKQAKPPRRQRRRRR